MGNNVNAFVPEVYSKTLLKESKELTNFKNNFTNSDFEGEIKAFGDTVRISTPNFSNISIGNSVIPDVSDIIPTDVTLVINKQKSFAFKVNDLEQAQSQFNLLSGNMSGGNQKMMDEICLELQEAIINDSGVPAYGTSSVPIEVTEDTITNYFTKIKQKLVRNKALSSSGFYTYKGEKEQRVELKPMVTVDPVFFETLLNSTKLTHPTVAGDDILYKGECGQIAGMMVFQDTNIEQVTGADPDNGVHAVIAGTKMGMTFAEQFVKVETIRDPQSFADIGRALMVYGYKITNPKSLVKSFATTISSST